MSTLGYRWLSAPGLSALSLLLLNPQGAESLGITATPAPRLLTWQSNGLQIDQVLVAACPGGVILCLHGGRATRESAQQVLDAAGLVPADLTPFDVPPAARPMLALLPRLESPLAVHWALGPLRGAKPGPATAAAEACVRHLLTPPRVQLWGPANSGKSSLLNAMCGHDVARTGPEAGLTRDVLEASFLYRGVKVRIFDAPGQLPGATGLEAAALALAEDWRRQADLTLELVPPGHTPQGVGLVLYSQSDRDPARRTPAVSVYDSASVQTVKEMLVNELLGPVLLVPPEQQVLPESVVAVAAALAF